MTVSLITLAIIGALTIIALLGLAWLAYTNAEVARTSGYDQGYDDAKFAAAHYTASLEEQLANTTGRLNKAKREHDQQLQDADRRIAIYAGRSWNRDDLATIRRASKQLRLAAITYSEFNQANLADPARFALTVAEQLETLAQRIEAQLDGNAPPVLATSQPEADAATAKQEAAA